jgi:hypothetical protein
VGLLTGGDVPEQALLHAVIVFDEAQAVEERENDAVSGLEQAIGSLVILGALILAAIYGGGFIWYRVVEYPLAIRRVKKSGIVVIDENVFGDSVFVTFAPKDWRHANFNEWRKANGSEKLWPKRVFNDEEILC